MITFEVDNLINMNGELQTFVDYLKKKDIQEDEIFDCRLVSCELITNVVRHCGEVAHFKARMSGNNIIISVSSKSSQGVVITPTLPDVFAESGRGLYIINAISGGDIKVVGNEIRVVIKIK
jgi:anti-sigma regulatory factor (Ser/Thr protein kinase)